MAPSVLLVDDEPFLLRLLAEVLSLNGFKVYTAHSREAALLVLHDTVVDLIITDTLLSRWDNQIPVLQQLQQAVPGTPIVLFTAHVEGGYLDPAACGLAAVWLKPMSLDQLVGALPTVLHDRERGADLQAGRPASAADRPTL